MKCTVCSDYFIYMYVWDYDYCSSMGAFTMDVIASSAFGLEIDSLNEPNNPFIFYAKKVFDFKSASMLIFTLCK